MNHIISWHPALFHTMEGNSIPVVDYKTIHEEFMQNLNGTTAADSIIVGLPTTVTVFISRAILFSLSTLELSTFSTFLIEFLVMILPLTFFFTVLSEYSTVILLTVVTVSLSILVVNFVLHHSNSKVTLETMLAIVMSDKKRAFITNYRATVNLITAISILAVDFKVFPRRYAKTENYGYGVMDVGVGLYCIANAIVTPEALSLQKRLNFFPSIYGAFKNSLPLVLLGVARFFSTKQIDYQQHISEYGIHWNFFITLAAVKIVCATILSVINPKHSLVVSIFLIAGHQFMLESGVSNWVLGESARDNLLSANREGIVSSLGYVVIFFAGIGLGRFIQRPLASLRDNLILELQLIVVAIFLWTCTFLCDHFFGVSRRLANAGYVMWVLAYGVTLITSFLLVEIMLRVFIMCRNARAKKKNKLNCRESLVPIVLDAISYNGLFFFMIANLFTGFINIMIQTLMQDAVTSLVIINLYMLSICLVAVLLHANGIKLKTW